jgi:prepilin-type N-terminal cleavage/methylation domain-containing protein
LRRKRRDGSFCDVAIKRIIMRMLTCKLSALLQSVPVWRERRGGFTLVEMLTVVSIAAILAILSVPALQGLQTAGGFDKSTYALADSLNLARSYAVANNTYVYVGVTEVDRTQNPGASPQVVGQGGRVAISMVATTDGTSDYSSSSSSVWTGANLTQVRQVQTFDGFHIASKVFPMATTGNMARPSNVETTPALLPAPSAQATPFSIPLGSAGSNGKYNFNGTSSEIICFNPQGGVLLTQNGVLSAVQWLEIDVQPMLGTVAPPAPANVNKGNQAALIVDGVTGAVNVYRP